MELVASSLSRLRSWRIEHVDLDDVDHQWRHDDVGRRIDDFWWDNHQRHDQHERRH